MLHQQACIGMPASNVCHEIHLLQFDPVDLSGQLLNLLLRLLKLFLLPFPVALLCSPILILQTPADNLSADGEPAQHTVERTWTAQVSAAQ